MYDELVALLRKQYDKAPMVMEAADAIEELSKRVPPVPHGDLIDRDGAVRDLRMDYAYAAARIVSLQPVIIPSEETNKEEA